MRAISNMTSHQKFLWLARAWFIVVFTLDVITQDYLGMLITYVFTGIAIFIGATMNNRVVTKRFLILWPYYLFGGNDRWILDNIRELKEMW